MNVYSRSLINLLVYALYAVCALLLLVDGLYHRHGYFGFEGWFGFYAFYGFGAYMLIVNSARLLRRLVRRDERYYD